MKAFVKLCDGEDFLSFGILFSITHYITEQKAFTENGKLQFGKCERFLAFTSITCNVFKSGNRNFSQDLLLPI